MRGDTTAAIADFTEAIRLNPKARARSIVAASPIAGPATWSARSTTTRPRIALNPIYALAYNNRGYVYEAQGRKDDAIADFQARCLLDPSLIGAREVLKRLGAAGRVVRREPSVACSGQSAGGEELQPVPCGGRHGASPNRKAPEFRNLHARHPSLALREPLSRGLCRAARRDAEVRPLGAGDRYHRRLYQQPGVGATGHASDRRGGQAVTPIADAEDIGDAGKGLAYAQKVCAGCHNVLRTEAASPNRQAPPFKKIANTPGMTVTALTVWSRTTHPTMPNLVIDPNDMDDLIAYILSLREQKVALALAGYRWSSQNGRRLNCRRR